MLHLYITVLEKFLQKETQHDYKQKADVRENEPIFAATPPKTTRDLFCTSDLRALDGER